MSDETILDLLDDVCAILDGLRSKLSCLMTSDTGEDPTSHIEDLVDNLRTKITEQTSTALPQPETLPTPDSQTKKDFS